MLTLQFTSEKMEAQRNKTPCPRSDNKELGWLPRIAYFAFSLYCAAWGEKTLHILKEIQGFETMYDEREIKRVRFF